MFMLLGIMNVIGNLGKPHFKAMASDIIGVSNNFCDEEFTHLVEWLDSNYGIELTVTQIESFKELIQNRPQSVISGLEVAKMQKGWA